MEFLGHEFQVNVTAYFRVVIAKTEDAEEADEQSFEATKMLFKDAEDVEVIDNKMVDIDQSNKHFTAVDEEIELIVNVVAYDQDDAFEKAETIVDAETDTLPGVKYQGCEAYDYHWNSDKVVDW